VSDQPQPLRTRIAQEMESHGLGWIDNGKPDIARCYCGYRPRIGESWHYHVTDVLIGELTDWDVIDQLIDNAGPRCFGGDQ